LAAGASPILKPIRRILQRGVPPGTEEKPF